MYRIEAKLIGSEIIQERWMSNEKNYKTREEAYDKIKEYLIETNQYPLAPVWDFRVVGIEDDKWYYMVTSTGAYSFFEDKPVKLY